MKLDLPLKFAGWTIEFNPDFSADRGFTYYHENHDGDNGLCGQAYTLTECLDGIVEIERNL